MKIPARERIVWENAEVRASLERGMQQAAEGKLVDRGSFARYLDDEDDAS